MIADKDETEAMESSGLADQASNLPDDGFAYQSFTAGSADVNTVATLDGIYRYVSAACLRLFGWNPAELEGRPQEDSVHPDDILSMLAGRESLASGKVTTTTFRFRRRDGSYLWTETTSRHVKADSHDLVVSTIRDIEQRRRSESPCSAGRSRIRSREWPTGPCSWIGCARLFAG